MAKLPRDLIRTLELADNGITTEQAAAGRSILDAWELLTGPVSYPSGQDGGYSTHDSDHAIRLQAIWRAWATELRPRAYVTPAVVVDLIRGNIPYVAATLPYIRASFDWWLKCARTHSTLTQRVNGG